MKGLHYGLVGVVLVLVSASTAPAYRYTSCGLNDCYWSQYPVGYVVSENVDDLFSGAARVVQESFARWTKDQQTFCELDFNQVGRTSIDRATDDFHNVVFARDSGWSYGKETLAVTICFYQSNGKVVDCDIAVNARDWKWSADGKSGTTLSFRDTLTHEVGHFWGLNHPESEYATMYAYYNAKTMAYDLDEDDIRAAADRFCDGQMPPDDSYDSSSQTGTGKQNDSIRLSAEYPEGGVLEGLRLYDVDAWVLRAEDGKFPLIEIRDREPERWKTISVYTGTPISPTLLGVSECLGDCVVAPTTEAIVGIAYYVVVESNFECSKISSETYDLTITQVASVSSGELSDHISDCGGDDDDDDDDDDDFCACGMAPLTQGGGDEPWAGLAVLGIFLIIIRLRKKGIPSTNF